MNSEDLAKIALDSKADIIIVENEAHLKKVGNNNNNNNRRLGINNKR